MTIIFKYEDVIVKDLSSDIVGNNYSVEDGETYYETSKKPHLDYESLKHSLFEYQEMKNEDTTWEAENL